MVSAALAADWESGADGQAGWLVGYQEADIEQAVRVETARQSDSWAEFEGRGQVWEEARNRRTTAGQRRSSTRTAGEL